MTELTPSFHDQSPLYDQLYRYIVSLIRSGELPAGEKLPSKRRLAEHLGLSLTTVERSYGLLTAEGYLESAPRSGYRVAPSLTVLSPEVPPVPPAPEVRQTLNECFSTSAVDTSVFPYTLWARLSREAVYQNPDLLQRGEGQGDWALRGALAGFLHQYRGVSCTPEQVVLGPGLEGLMWVLLQLLPGTVFGLEDPGYASVQRLLDNLNWPYEPIPVDSRGMSVEALSQSGAGVAYVTPSHQFPLGVTTPVGRRSELLRWAYEKPGRYLIEDDYDSEFRYATRPIPAMQGMDLSHFAPRPAGGLPGKVRPPERHRLPLRAGDTAAVFDLRGIQPPPPPGGQPLPQAPGRSGVRPGGLGPGPGGRCGASSSVHPSGKGGGRPCDAGGPGGLPGPWPQ